MIFRRRQDEMEGFRRMREALRQQADPHDHALLDEQYETYDDEAELNGPGEEAEGVALEDATELDELEEYEQYDGQVEVRPDDASAAPTMAAMGPAPTASEVFPTPPATGSPMTTLGADTSWSGTLRSESNVYLEGKVEGTLEARDTIYVAERATIDARLKARSIVISGQVNGHIDCEGRLEVTPTGRLNGEIEAGSLVVHEGAVLDGKFKMKGGAVIPGR